MKKPGHFTRLLALLLALAGHTTALSSELPHNKHWGVELNPFRFFAVGDHAVSGGFAYFDHTRRVEIAMPIFYQYDNSSSFPDETYRETTVDLHYRKYLGKRLQGIYLSAFLRYAHLYGNAYATRRYDGQGNYVLGGKRTEDKLGAGLGIGLRAFFDNGVYLGASLMFGRYLTGNQDIFSGDDDITSEDGRQIVDIELLKIGYAF